MYLFFYSSVFFRCFFLFLFVVGFSCNSSAVSLSSRVLRDLCYTVIVAPGKLAGNNVTSIKIRRCQSDHLVEGSDEDIRYKEEMQEIERECAESNKAADVAKDSNAVIASGAKYSSRTTKLNKTFGIINVKKIDGELYINQGSDDVDLVEVSNTIKREMIKGLEQQGGSLDLKAITVGQLGCFLEDVKGLPQGILNSLDINKYAEVIEDVSKEGAIQWEDGVETKISSVLWNEKDKQQKYECRRDEYDCRRLQDKRKKLFQRREENARLQAEKVRFRVDWNRKYEKIKNPDAGDLTSIQRLERIFERHLDDFDRSVEKVSKSIDKLNSTE